MQEIDQRTADLLKTVNMMVTPAGYNLDSSSEIDDDYACKLKCSLLYYSHICLKINSVEV